MRKFNEILLMMLFLLSFIPTGCNQMQEKKSSSVNKIEIISHRGANREAPENTFAAAQKAIEAGATYIEVDARPSKDSIIYNFHDRTLDRTTNGTGLFSETTSDYINGLDAGSWFGHEFAGEKIPRIDDFLQWIKGKAKVFIDWKGADLKQIIDMVYKAGMENECMFYFSDLNVIKEFRVLDQKLPIKMNASEISQLDTLVSVYNIQIIDIAWESLNDEFINTCKQRGLKVMVHTPGNDIEGFRKVIQMDIDYVTVDEPHIFTNMLKNNGVFKDYKLIAHRGGITRNEYNEFDPASIQKAIDVGYYMLEIDVRMTKDGVLIVNHDGTFHRFFNDPRRVDEMTWEEIQTLKSDRGNYHPLSFEEVAKMCSGKIKMMIDVKVRKPTPEYFKKMGEIMDKYNLLDGAYFINYEPMEYFWGRGKFLFRMREIPEIMKKLENGEDVACNYFLFDGGNVLSSNAIKWCQQNYITVVPSVNYSHYKIENHWHGAKRDIEFLKECGVTEFQIDSHYDKWLPWGE